MKQARIYGLPALVTLIAITAIPRSASAASFDCAQTTSASEKTICADPALSTADERLASAYDAALSRLSKAGQDALQGYEGSWLRYRDELCAPAPGSKSPGDEPPASCLATEIGDRTKLLGEEGRRLGPYVMMTLGSFVALRHTPDGTDPMDTGLNTQTAIWPRIDSPENPQTTGWNHWIEHALRPKGESDVKGEAVFRAETVFDPAKDVALPSGAIITVAVESSVDSGGAHPSGQTQSFTYLLDKGRELQPTDLFDAKKPWAETLGKQSFALLKIELRDELQAANDRDLADIVTSPRSWTLGKQGLSIRFPPYSVAAYFVGEPEIVIPWRQLQGVLAAKSVFAIP